MKTDFPDTTVVSADPRVKGVVGVDAVDSATLARTGLSRVDYVDHFAIRPVDGSAATPEEWARSMFGDVPTPGERFIWQWVLQLRLAPGRSRHCVAGWRITARGEDWVRMETGSWALGASLVVRATDAVVSLTTALRYDREPGGLIWRPLSAVHRRLVPRVLQDAVDKIQV